MPNTQKCVERFGDLGAFKNIFDDTKGLPKSLTPDFVLRFLILTYTPSSPFVKAYMTDLKTRKTKTLEYLGINHQDQLTPALQDMVLLKNVSVAHRWITFLRIQSNEDWLFLTSAQERYVKLLEASIQMSKKGEGEAMDAMDEKRKNEMLGGLRDQIKEGLETFMAGERSKELENFVSFTLLSDSYNIMPEEYVRIWAETKKLPYDLQHTGL